MNIIEVIGIIVVVTTVTVAVLGIGFRRAKRMFDRRTIRDDLEKAKQLPTLKIIKLYRFMLGTAVSSNLIGIIVLIDEWSDSRISEPINTFIRHKFLPDVFILSPVIFTLGIISFVATLTAVKIICKHHISEWKIITIVNLTFGSFLLFYNFIMVGFFRWIFPHFFYPFA